MLIDSRDLHYEALNRALALQGSQYVISYADHLASFDGLPTKTKLNMLTQTRGLSVDVHDAIFNKKQELTLEVFAEKINMNEHIFSAVEKLYQSGYKIGVASNAVRQTVLVSLEKLGIAKFVSSVVSNEEISNPKPHPEIYIKALSELKQAPEDVLVCEDNAFGKEAALRAGCKLCPIACPDQTRYDYIERHIAYYNSFEKSVIPSPWIDTPTMNIVIPMAGAGSRFANVGYKDIKPMIKVGRKPMIKVVCDNLNLVGKFIFIVQKAHNDAYKFDKWMSMICGSNPFEIVQVDKLTEGAACTVLAAKEFINNDNPMLIANSDQFIEWDSAKFMYDMVSNDADGGILTFHCPSKDKKWSFAKHDEKGVVSQVKEKDAISETATVGVYYWKMGKQFVAAAEEMIACNDRVNNEFYVCPVYNYNIKHHQKVVISNCKKMWGIGTPEDLEHFMANFKGSF